MASNTAPSKSTVKKGGGFIPALCNFIGTVILLLVIISCLPLALPRFLGYEVYNVTSGSMAPAIPVGSAIFVKDVPPSEILEGDVITFRKNNVVVSHRVITNRIVSGEFVTKGDANAGEDFDTVPYDDYIGRVEKHYPVIGQALLIYSSNVGKMYVLVFAACGLMFNVLAGRLRASRREKRLAKEDKKLLEEMLKERKEEELRKNKE